MLMIANCLFSLHQGTDSAVALNGLQLSLASVQSWMLSNKLKPNPDKTELLLSGTNDIGANSSLCFLSRFSVSKLTLQNRLAHIVTKSPPFTRSAIQVHSRHWCLIKITCLSSLHACPITAIPFTEITQGK